MNASQIAAHLRDFDEHTIWHAALNKAFAGACRSIGLARGDGRITVVLGVSGVGKERLAQELRSQLAKEHGIAPVYAEVASGSSTAPVSMSALYDRILTDLGSIGRNYVVATTRRPPGLRIQTSGPQWARLTAIDNLSRVLRIPAIIVDEAQYLVAMRNPERRRHNLRVFSYLANRKCAPIVLLGTLELLEAIKTAPDVHRRIRLVLFDRYRSPHQMPAFASAVLDYEEFLKDRHLLAEGFSVVDERTRLYGASLGCIGNLHNLVFEALSDALVAGHLMSSRDFDEPERSLIPDRQAFEQEVLKLETKLDKLQGVSSSRPGDESPADEASRAARRGHKGVPVGEVKKVRHPVGEGRGLRPRAVGE